MSKRLARLMAVMAVNFPTTAGLIVGSVVGSNLLENDEFLKLVPKMEGEWAEVVREHEAMLEMYRAKGGG